MLQGGRRRRRPGPVLALAALALAPLAVVVALALALSSGGSGPPRAAAGAAAGLAPGGSQPLDPAPPGSPYAVRLETVDAFGLRFRRQPRAGLVFDLRTGDVLWQRRALRVLPIASLTKIMTAIVVVERARPAEPVRITRAAVRYRGSGVGLLPKGRHVRLETLMYGLLLPSGNDAAIALAQHVGGSEPRFVAAMNSKARELGLRCTRFVSPHGLEDGDRSCAADLAALARYAMRKPRIARIVGRASARLRFPIKGGHLYLYNNNPLLRQGFPGTIGLKTGYTAKAGRSLVAVVRRGSRTLGAVLLHSPDPAPQARRLFNRALSTPRAG